MASKKSAPKKDISVKAKVSLGIGLTAAALAAASTYFLVGSKSAPQNRKKVKGWTLKAKGEVLEALEKAQEIRADEYRDLVETATNAYGTMKDASKGELKDFRAEMLEHWNKLQKNKAVKKIAGGISKPAVKKAVKKVVKKAAKKVVG